MDLGSAVGRDEDILEHDHIVGNCCGGINGELDPRQYQCERHDRQQRDAVEAVEGLAAEQEFPEQVKGDETEAYLYLIN